MHTIRETYLIVKNIKTVTEEIKQEKRKIILAYLNIMNMNKILTII